MSTDTTTRVTDPEALMLLDRALTAIRDMEPEPVEELPEHKDCAECDRLWNLPYSVSKVCDERYRQITRRDRFRNLAYDAQGGAHAPHRPGRPVLGQRRDDSRRSA